MTTKRTRSVAGRAVVFLLFFVVVAYFGTAIFGSIINQLYGKPPPESNGELGLRERTWCIRTIVGLRDELEGQVTLEMQHPKREGDPAARFRLWQEGWQAKLDRARDRCVDAGNKALDRAYQQLTELERGYGASVERMIQTRARVAPQLQDSLAELKAQR